ncbi:MULTISPECIES: hypothetical protein [unclassified Synechococcus]|uniref:hypothetical protein n=1 Tax=unclassified Synechococcus TaxID=2626047 RepID=UPI0039B0C503
MAKGKLPPLPEALVPPPKDSPEWPSFCEANPLHMAACRKASTVITEARVNLIIHWFHKGAAYVTVVHKGSAQWGLCKRRVEELN